MKFRTRHTTFTNFYTIFGNTNTNPEKQLKDLISKEIKKSEGLDEEKSEE